MQRVIENYKTQEKQEKMGARNSNDLGNREIEMNDKGDFMITDKSRTIMVAKEDVDFLYKIISENCEMQRKYGHKFIVNKIIEEKDLDLDYNSFGGGENRAKAYFPMLYFPLKILQFEKVIYHSPKGGFIWINERE